MSSLPKPKFCDQNWIQMTPTEKGRLCTACQKNIVDFSKMRWAAIEQLQGENGNLLCGMYSDKQLEYWGREVPAPRVSRFVRAATFLLGFATMEARAQSGLPADTLVQKLIVKGIVTEKSTDGEVYPLTSAIIRLLRNGKLIAGAAAGIDGDYNITVLEPINKTDSFSVQYSFVGFESISVDLRPSKEGIIWYDAQLPRRKWSEADYFYVRKPTRLRMLWWRFKGIF